MGTKIDIESLATFCKKKGFVYQSSEIYGGYSGFFDFGPLGVELFNNIKQHWWRTFIQEKENMVGIDASIVSHPKTWHASGHVKSFGDQVLICSKCKHRARADHLIEDSLSINADGLEPKEINALVKKHKLSCLKCKGKFESLKDFNLLFETNVGASSDSTSKAYLRGETAQAMFMDFKLIAETSRMQLPFGVGQIGRCFRNEIAPRDFLFRCREFHIAELEFFINPNDKKCPLLSPKHKNLKVRLLDTKAQKTKGKRVQDVTIKKMLDQDRLGEWHAYWLAEQFLWYTDLGLDPKNLTIREHVPTELSFYSSSTFDIDYSFPFGSKEICGNANRGQYDLNQHIKTSSQKLQIFDEATKVNVIPRVIEPAFGMERAFLAVLCEAYHDDKSRGNVVLKLHPQLAPIQIGIFPLVSNNKKLVTKSREIYDSLKSDFRCFYDSGGSIGRRYARLDEVGGPFGITIDHDSLKDKQVTVRLRDSRKQLRIKIKDLPDTLKKFIEGEKNISIGK
ncbi:glycine--tRNA ligase [archaeon]|nr:glycine--tRNA ligase [archaeon]